MAKTTLIGSLKISLLAVTKGYERGLGKAAKTTKRFSRLLRTNVSTALATAAGKLTAFGLKGLGSIPRLVASAAKALLKLVTILGVTLVAAAGAATAALVLMAKNSFKELDRVAKSSRIIGVMVSELQVFEQASKEAGVETKVLEKSLRNMTRQVNDAAKGTGEAIDGLRDLGLDAKELISLSIPDQFIAIADALAEISSEGERIQIASDLFGARGLALLNLNTQALKDIDMFLESIGAKVDDIDARKIEATNDASSKLRLTLKAIGDQLAIRIAPFLTGVVKRIIAFVQGLGGVGVITQKVIARASELTVSALNIIGEAFQNVVKFMQDNGTTIATVFSNIVGASTKTVEIILLTFGGLQAGFKVITSTIKFLYLGFLATLSAGTIAFVDGALTLLNKIPGVDLKVSETLKAFADTAAADLVKAELEVLKAVDSALIGGVDKTVSQIGLRVGDIGRKAQEAILDLGAASIPVFEAMAAKLDELGPLGTELNELLNQLRSSFDGLGEDIKDVPVLELKTDLDKLTPTLDRLETAFDDVGDNLAGALLKGENAFESLAKTAVSALNDIAAALFKKGLFAALFSLFGGGGGPVASIFGGLAGISPTPSVSSPGLGSVPSLAGGGGGLTVNNNFFGPTSGDAAIKAAATQAIVEAAPALTNQAVNATSDRAQRDPNFRRQFA